MKTTRTGISVCLSFLIFHFSLFTLNAQNVAINNTGAPPAASAILDVSSTAAGMLVPRMTTAQLNAISLPATSLFVFNITTGCFEFYTGSTWQNLGCACSSAPSTPGNITGPATACVSSNQTYSVSPISGALFYTWSVPGGATISSGQGTTGITVNYGSSASSGNITITATGSCGTSSPNTLAVTLNTAPAAPGSITGNSSVCANTGSYVYSVTPVTGATSYSWTLPSGWSVSNGSGTATITAASGSSGGNISVTATNSCGTSLSSPALAVTVPSSNIPAAPGTISGLTSVNAAQTGVTYSVTAVSGATTYNWTVPSGASVTAGQGTNSITVTFGSSSGNVCVTAGNICGTSSSSCTSVSVASYTTMSWVDQTTGSCSGTMYQTMINIANAMPSGPINVRITANQVAPLSGFGHWSTTFLNTTCVKAWLEAWGTLNINTFNNWNPAVCQATDTTGTAYFFVCKNDGGNDPQIAIYPTTASPGQYMKIYVLDRTGPWCDLAGVDNRVGDDDETTNSNDAGVAGDSITFTWW